MDTAMACGPLETTNYQHLYCSFGDYNPSNEKLSGFCQSLAPDFNWKSSGYTISLSFLTQLTLTRIDMVKTWKDLIKPESRLPDRGPMPFRSPEQHFWILILSLEVRLNKETSEGYFKPIFLFKPPLVKNRMVWFMQFMNHLREPSVRFAKWERANRTLGSRRCIWMYNANCIIAFKDNTHLWLCNYVNHGHVANKYDPIVKECWEK